MSYFNCESDESTNAPLMVTVVAVKSIFVPVAGSSVLHNTFFVPATDTCPLKVDEASFVKLPVFSVAPNVLSVDNQTAGVVELSDTLLAVFDVVNVTSVVERLVP